MRAALSVLQSALSVVLLIGAALFVESLHRARTSPLGFDPDRVLRVEPRLSSALAAEKNRPARYDQSYASALELLQRQPWVEHAAITIGSPFGFGFGVDVTVPGRDSLSQVSGQGASITAVTSDFFATLGIALRAGRTFTPADRRGSSPVVVVNETMARAVWPGLDPLGKCLIVGDRVSNPERSCSVVVGVVGDVHHDSVREPPTMQYYVPLGQEAGIGGSVLVVRPRVPMERARALAREVVLAVPEFSFASVETLQEAIDPEFKPWQLGASMFTMFGILALGVAAIGLYSLMAYLVEIRRREFGVRMALGATSGRISREVVGRGVATATFGTAFGILAALAAGSYVRPLLYDTNAGDPVILTLVAAAVLIIAVVASWLPAHRASRTDPAIALRADG